MGERMQSRVCPGRVTSSRVSSSSAVERSPHADRGLDPDRAGQMGVVVVQLPDLGEVCGDCAPARRCVAARELEQRKGAGQTVDRSGVVGLLGGPQQFGDLAACPLGIAPQRRDLGQDHQAQRLGHLPAGLARRPPSPRRTAARPRPRLRLATSIRARKNRHAPTPGSSRSYASAISSPPQGARLVVTVGSAELPRERGLRGAVARRARSWPARAVRPPPGSARSRRAVEQVASNAAGAPERDLGDRHQAEDEQVRLRQLLGEREPLVRKTSALAVVASCGREARELAEDVMRAAGSRARARQVHARRASAAVRLPSVAALTQRERAERIGSRPGPGSAEPTASSSSAVAFLPSPA